jgi:flagellar hook-basal body complex protein FliE
LNPVEMTPLPAIQPLMPVLPVSPAEQPGALAPARPADDSFGAMLGRMVAEVNARQIGAAQAVNQLQAGDPVSLHQAVIAMEEANVSFQLMVEVRNKLLDAYQEIMRMQI